jgi:hypothetical protein
MANKQPASTLFIQNMYSASKPKASMPQLVAGERRWWKVLSIMVFLCVCYEVGVLDVYLL